MRTPLLTNTIVTTQPPLVARVVDLGDASRKTAGADSTGEDETGSWYCATADVPLIERR